MRILHIHSLFVYHGWRVFFWFFVPMNVAQDFKQVNGGWDIIRFGALKNSYFRGTYWENMKFTTHSED